MQIVIDIPRKTYIDNLNGVFEIDTVRKALKEGTLLPKGHGKLGDLDKIKKEMQNCEASNADNAVLSKEDRAMLDGMRDTAYVCGYRGGDVEFAVNKALRRMRRFDLLPPCEREESEGI